MVSENVVSQGDRIRYFFDEHIDPGVASYLRSHTIDVLTAFEAGRANQKISDKDQLHFATSQGRVLVSRDKHFLNPHEAPQLTTGQHAGIISLRRMVGIGDQARFLRFIAETETAQSMQGLIRYYEPIPRSMFPDDQ
jgi:predicted nuclease of predicted toxin-antitoxin system